MNKFFLILSFLVSFKAFAINLQSFRFTDGYRYSLVEDSYQEKFKGSYVFSSAVGYTNAPFTLVTPEFRPYRTKLLTTNMF